ncbi:MAG TPA: hypothetical protein VMS31_17205 [Pyrinomonadaceae bacterium]|nr:hypothetical protein [Pyrinomonadaceae bacterium]
MASVRRPGKLGRLDPELSFRQAVYQDLGVPRGFELAPQDSAWVIGGPHWERPVELVAAPVELQGQLSVAVVGFLAELTGFVFPGPGAASHLG